jgi:hypothetical protein
MTALNPQIKQSRSHRIPNFESEFIRALQGSRQQRPGTCPTRQSGSRSGRATSATPIAT